MLTKVSKGELTCKHLHEKEIAEVLCISENTVKTHITRVYGKLEVANRSELLLQIVQRQKNHTG